MDSTVSSVKWLSVFRGCGSEKSGLKVVREAKAGYLLALVFPPRAAGLTPGEVPHMDSTVSSVKWLSVFREVFAQTDGSANSVKEALAARRFAEPAMAAIAAAFADGVAELAAYADARLADEATAVDAEADAIAVSRRIVRPVLQAKLQARLDVLDEKCAGKAVCPDCGRTVESEGRRSRWWASILGPLQLKRRYASCKHCERGVAPAQKVLGFSDSDFTPRLEEVSTMMATTVPFGMATDLLAKLCGIEVSIKGVEEMVERRAAALQLFDAEEAETCAPFDEKGLPVENQQRPVDAAPCDAPLNVAYLETDGVIPITREELTGKELTPTQRRRIRRAQKAKARGGKGRRYRIVGREVKNAVLYDGKDCVPESTSRSCILEKTYVSHLGDWFTFATLVWVTILRLGFDRTKLLVVLSDGAEWVKSLAEWLPIPTFLILDLYHAKHRIWEVAHSLYGEHSARASQWAAVQCDRVEAGHVGKVIEALKFLEPKRAETRKLVGELAKYFENNRGRMDYPAYRAKGLRISSAAVESANFHVTGTRLKLQGMRWSAEGAGQMAALRADLFNGRWEARTKRLLAA